MSSFLSRLFGGRGGAAGAAGRTGEPGEPVGHQGLFVIPAPVREGSQWRVAGAIARDEGDGAPRREFTRADTVASREEAVTLSVRKGRQIIDERGATLFAEGSSGGPV